MSVTASVYKAAKDDKLDDLKRCVRWNSSDSLSSHVNQTIKDGDEQGATPLTAAAKNGHCEVVQYLVEKCGADVELVGSVKFDDKTINGAPPLWCAAAAGHLNIVKYLIHQSANVNNTTSTNSTPLRAACFEGYYEVAKYLLEHHADIEIANQYGVTCLMNCCGNGHLDVAKLLLKNHADVNRGQCKGRTALHFCAEYGHLEVLKLLLLHNAKMDKDDVGSTPLLEAATNGHTNIVEYLITRDEVLVVETAEALELLGAWFVDDKDDINSAVKYWKKALLLRNKDPSHRIAKPAADIKVCAYGEKVEIENVDQLEDMMNDHDEIRMQALLVRERILGPAHPDTSFYIRCRGAKLAEIGVYDRCIALWMYALDMGMNRRDALSEDTRLDFLSFCCVFKEMKEKKLTIKFSDIHSIFGKAIAELKRGQNTLKDTTSLRSYELVQNCNQFLLAVLHMMSLVRRLTDSATSDEVTLFNRQVQTIIKMDPRGSNGRTLLHLAVSSDTTDTKDGVCTFASPNCVELLLKLGAAVEVLDLEKNSALHIACMQDNPDRQVVSALLQANAPTDCVNMKGKRPLEYM